MVKIIVAAVWLGVNLRSLVHIIRGSSYQSSTDKGSVSLGSMVLNLRRFLSQRQDNAVRFLEALKADPELLRNFRLALVLTGAGLLVELGFYAVITVSFESWWALIFGGLVLASHLQSLILLVLLASLVGSRQWFVLTFKKMQLLIVPALVLEVLWLAYLVLLWSGLV